MSPEPIKPARAGATHPSAAIDNLRAIVVLLVIAVHSSLAYLASASKTPYPFDRPPWDWRTFPILDPHRFLGFDIFCAWADVFLMPLFFLVSGFFVWQSLARNGPLAFARRRASRLVPPFVLGVAFLMPIAVYPAYAQTSPHPGLAGYWQELVHLPFWPDGPMWFLWVLLVFDLAAAAAFRIVPHQRVARLSAVASRNPTAFLAGFFLLSLLAYVPLGAIFGPMRWFQVGPFSFQLNCIGIEAFYFFGGVVIGARGFAPSEPLLARRWKQGAAAALATFAIWLLASAKTFTTPHPSVFWQFIDAVALVPACLASCCAALGLTARFAAAQTRLLDSLRANAFGMYWVHAVFVAWLQYAALALPWPALLKWPLVFSCAVAASWAATIALRRAPIFNAMFGAAQPRPLRKFATIGGVPAGAPD